MKNNLTLTIFIYLSFAFVEAEINPIQWKQSVRFGFVFAIITCFTIKEMIKNIKKE